MKRKTSIAGAATLALTSAPLGFQFLDYQNPIWGRALVALSIVLALYVIAEVCLWLVPGVRFSLIPLPEAAASLYEEARGRGSLWALAAESLSGPNISHGSPDQVLNWVATWIIGHAEIQGTRPPSKSREAIRERNGVFEEGAEHYRTHGNFFTNLAVKRGDLRRLSKEIRKGDAANEMQQDLAAVTELNELRARHSVLEVARHRLRILLNQAKSQLADVQSFIRIWHESPSPMSGVVAMHPSALENMTTILRDAIAAAQATGFAKGLEAPIFVAPPDIVLKKGGNPETSVFYRNDNWPYLADTTRFGDRSAEILGQLSGQSFLLEKELQVTAQKMDVARKRLAKR